MQRIPGSRRVAGLFVTVMLASLMLPTAVLGGVTSFSSGASGLSTHSQVCTSAKPCLLDLTAPGSVVEDEAFTVEVALKKTDGSVTDKCDGSVVKLYAAPDGGEPGVVASASLAAGRVSWGGIQLAAPGTYQLRASLTSQNCSAADDTAMIVVDPAPVVVTCPANAICSASTQSQSGNAKAEVTAGAGATITAVFGDLDYTACGGAVPADPGGVLTFDVLNGKLLKLVQFTIVKSLVGQTKLADFKVCWNSPVQFKAAGGQWAAADGGGTFTGNLPNCLTKNPTLPCILLRTKNGAGDVTLHVIAKPGDPKGYVSK